MRSGADPHRVPRARRVVRRIWPRAFVRADRAVQIRACRHGGSDVDLLDLTPRGRRTRTSRSDTDSVGRGAAKLFRTIATCAAKRDQVGCSAAGGAARDARSSQPPINALPSPISTHISTTSRVRHFHRGRAWPDGVSCAADGAAGGRVARALSSGPAFPHACSSRVAGTRLPPAAVMIRLASPSSTTVVMQSCPRRAGWPSSVSYGEGKGSL